MSNTKLANKLLSIVLQYSKYYEAHCQDEKEGNDTYNYVLSRNMTVY